MIENNNNSINILNEHIKVNFKNRGFYEKVKNIFGKRIVDLFLHMPTEYIHRISLNEKLNNSHINKNFAIELKIIKHEKSFHKKSPYTIFCKNKFEQIIKLIFFNVSPSYMKNILHTEKKYKITGTIDYFSNFYQIIHPENIVEYEKMDNFETIEPVYNFNRNKLNRKIFRNLILKNLKHIVSFTFPEEWIDQKVLKKFKWFSLKESIIKIHKPKKTVKKSEIEKIRRRLAYDEILSNFLIIYHLKKEQKNNHSNIYCNKEDISNEITKNLSFKLTNDQKKVINEIKYDIRSSNKMFRLIQGDVGSGKTIISLISVADVINSGFQAAIMVPTEILARQHHKYFSEIFKNFNVNISLLTGKTLSKEKNKIYDDLLNNRINILIGTHSLFNKKLKFYKLGLIVIDEQHKFGVNQRLNLQNKSSNCHILVMSATPIPRSLTFAIYGEIQLSILKEKPKGRKEINTYIISNKKIKDLIEGIKRKIKKNEKVFWVLPQIGKENESIDGKESILSRYSYLNKYFSGKIAFIHGKMKKNEVNEIMEKFKNEDIMILVSTTVIEVGVDIPNASLIIIEHANRFGLAQLHQLRGRIGRGKLNSDCILIHHNDLSPIGKERLLTMKNSNDGFFIAEQDLKLRGGGQIFGTKQTGLPKWRFFNPYLDIDFIDDVRKNCDNIIKSYELNEEKIDFLTNIFFREKEIDIYFTG